MDEPKYCQYKHKIVPNVLKCTMSISTYTKIHHTKITGILIKNKNVPRTIHRKQYMTTKSRREKKTIHPQIRNILYIITPQYYNQ